MPRKGRGGARQGTTGTVYTNRTDLNQPISTVPNQEYGKATAQREAQRAIPMGASPVSAAPQSMPAAPAQAAAQPLPRPGQLPYLEQTNRPSEPVTAGLDFGPGPGSEAMRQNTVPIMQRIASASRGTTSPILAELGALASSMGD